MPIDTVSALPAEVTLPQPFRILDLTHTLDADFPYIPVPGITFPFGLEPIATLEEHHVAANAWRVHEHLGTQIDAPSHFAAGGLGLDQLEAEQLLVPAVVIDFRRQARLDPDAELAVADLQAWEARHGRIPDGAAVLLYTGWDTRLSEPEFVGLDAAGVKHFPGIGLDAARLLLDQRSIWGVGVDTLSFDPGVDDQYRTHRAVLGAGKWALECLANLRFMPPRGAVLFVGAPKVRDATGGPVRVIAMAPPVPVLDATSIDGIWRSEQPEPRRRADGSVLYLQRKLTVQKGRWKIHFTVSASADGAAVLLTGDFGGRLEIGSYSPLAEAFEARFLFEHRSLTPASDEVASALTAAGCGAEPWIAGSGQDVHQQGCLPFRVVPVADCPAELDLLALDGDRLFLGSRPASGQLCNERQRPMAIGAPLVRRP